MRLLILGSNFSVVWGLRFEDRQDGGAHSLRVSPTTAQTPTRLHRATLRGVTLRKRSLSL